MPSAAKKAAVAAAEAPMEQMVSDEIAKFKAIKEGFMADSSSIRFYKNNSFDHKAFWYEKRKDLPLHYSVFVAEVGCYKAASANVETVFSGVGGMVQKSTNIGADLVADYTICHYNWKYSWLEPSEEEIVKAYQELYGPEAHVSDDSESEADDEEDDEEDDDEEGAE